MGAAFFLIFLMVLLHDREIDSTDVEDTGLIGSWTTIDHFYQQPPNCPVVINDNFLSRGSCGLSPSDPCLINMRVVNRIKCKNVYKVVFDMHMPSCTVSEDPVSGDSIERCGISATTQNLYMYAVLYAGVTVTAFDNELSKVSVNRMVSSRCTHFCNFADSFGTDSQFCLRQYRGQLCPGDIAPTVIKVGTDVAFVLMENVQIFRTEHRKYVSSTISGDLVSLSILPAVDLGRNMCSKKAQWPIDMTTTCGSMSTPCEVFIVSTVSLMPLDCSCLYIMNVTIQTGLATDEHMTKTIHVRFRDTVLNLTSRRFVNFQGYNEGLDVSHVFREVIPGLLLDHRFFINLNCNYHCFCDSVDLFCKLTSGSLFLCSHRPCTDYDSLFDPGYESTSYDFGFMEGCHYTHHWEDNNHSLCPSILVQLSQYAFATEIEPFDDCGGHLLISPTLNTVTHSDSGLCGGKFWFPHITSGFICGDDEETACPMNYRFLNIFDLNYCHNYFSVLFKFRRCDSVAIPGCTRFAMKKLYTRPWNSIQHERKPDFNKLYQIDESLFVHWLRRNCPYSCQTSNDQSAVGFCRISDDEPCSFDSEVTNENYNQYIMNTPIISKFKRDAGDPCVSNPCPSLKKKRSAAYDDDTACMVENGSFKCLCANHFYWSSKKNGCVQINYCETKEGTCISKYKNDRIAFKSYKCLQTLGNYACDCDTENGYQWILESEQCEKNNPCGSRPCDSIAFTPLIATCTKIDKDTFSCDCNEDYHWDEKTTLCRENDPCHPNPCKNQKPSDHYVDDDCWINSLDQTHKCNCISTHYWENKTNSCRERDPCHPNPCENYQPSDHYVDDECRINSLNQSYKCNCISTHYWDTDPKSCAEDGPCKRSPCQLENAASCISLGTSYACECVGEYVWIDRSKECQGKVIAPFMGDREGFLELMGTMLKSHR